MTTDIAVAASPRDLALLKAVGLDRAAPEQRELALAIAERYGLDLMLKHLVLIEGRPYLTRDALRHVAHRSGQLDGIEATVPEVVGDEWRCTATVWRRDMSHPFTYPGRYPVKGGNARFAPEMATKVAESMALRRAFDIGAPSADERWDVDVPAEPPAPAPSLAETARARAAAVIPTAIGVAPWPERVGPPEESAIFSSQPMTVAESAATAAPTRCDSPSPYGEGGEPCAREAGHAGAHRNPGKESW